MKGCPKCKSLRTEVMDNRRGECGKLHKVKFCWDCGHKVVVRE